MHVNILKKQYIIGKKNRPSSMTI